MSDWLEAFADESNKIEGMDPASLKELNALAAFIAMPLVTTGALETYVAVVAPGHVLRRTKGLNVRVGNHIAPPGGPDIEKALKELLSNMGTGTPYHTHVAYEMLHPFTDGNGRSGRALWLWQHISRDTDHQARALGFLHSFYYETLQYSRAKPEPSNV